MTKEEYNFAKTEQEHLFFDASESLMMQYATENNPFKNKKTGDICQFNME